MTIAKAPAFQVIEWDDFILALEEILGLPFNERGYWPDSSDTSSFSVHWPSVDEDGGVMRGRNKLSLRFTLSPETVPETPSAAEDFVAKYNMGIPSGHNGRDRSHPHKEISLRRLLCLLARHSRLEVGVEYCLSHSW